MLNMINIINKYRHKRVHFGLYAMSGCASNEQKWTAPRFCDAAHFCRLAPDTYLLFALGVNIIIHILLHNREGGISAF